jgi:hypothetical protein
VACSAAGAAREVRLDSQLEGVANVIVSQVIGALDELNSPEAEALADDLKSAANPGAELAAIRAVTEWCESLPSS